MGIVELLRGYINQNDDMSKFLAKLDVRGDGDHSEIREDVINLAHDVSKKINSNNQEIKRLANLIEHFLKSYNMI